MSRGFVPVKPSALRKGIRRIWSRIPGEEYEFDFKKPIRSTKHSAGYDFFSPLDFELRPGESITIPTGFKVYMEEDECLKLHPRSGQGFKFFVRLANTTGIIDSDYYGNPKNDGHILIKIRNEGEDVMEVEKGEAFAQGIFQKYLITDDDSFEEGKEREGGIGSTDE